MDPVTAIGLASGILTFISFGHNVLARLADFNSNLHDIPKSLQGIKDELPLLLDLFDRIARQTNFGLHGKGTRVGVQNVLDRCNAQVGKLEKILDETIPSTGAGRTERSLKAIKSLGRDGKLQEIRADLDRCKQTLILHQVTVDHRNEREGKLVSF